MTVHSNSGSQGSRHRCSCLCLGPLAFHPSAVGAHLTLARGRALAQRKECTFNNALAFSSRPVRVGEKVFLQVKKHVGCWTGALRLGFTNVPPESRPLPPPPLAIPDLTDTVGHWASVVPEPLCFTGSAVHFWVSHGGNIYCRTRNIKKHKLLGGVDLSRPLWAMLDIYGQTCAVFLLGSTKRQVLWKRKSCPQPSSHANIRESSVYLEDLCSNNRNCVCFLRRLAHPEENVDCVACLEQPASNTLLCGHRCLCQPCALRVIQDFGTCPLCRKEI